MEKNKLKHDLKVNIIKYLNILEYTPETINDDMPLFGEGLELDSIDSLELIVMLEREFGIKITNPAEGRKILATIDSMADFIIETKNNN